MAYSPLVAFFQFVAVLMLSRVAAAVPQPSPQSETRLSPNVIGACLRSAFIETLYQDCTHMLPAEEREATAAAQAKAQVTPSE
jgi:hypothetical protein